MQGISFLPPPVHPQTILQTYPFCQPPHLLPSSAILHCVVMTVTLLLKNPRQRKGRTAQRCSFCNSTHVPSLPVTDASLGVILSASFHGFFYVFLAPKNHLCPPELSGTAPQIFVLPTLPPAAPDALLPALLQSLPMDPPTGGGNKQYSPEEDVGIRL